MALIEGSKIALITLGCPKNEVDSGVVAGELARYGMVFVDRPEEAEVILINTCGFIEEAKRESVDAILRAVALKKNGHHPRVYVWGCLSERYGNVLRKSFPEIDGTFGIEPFREMGRVFLGNAYDWQEDAFYRRILTTPSHSAYMKIAEGCDHRCTFCAIPMIKGAYRSRSIPHLAEEARCLADRGVKELILIAQDTTAYGSDLKDGSTLAGLLEALMPIDGIEWIRLLYGHPAHVSDDVIRLMAEKEKICRYFDLPFQHVSDAVLRSMGRAESKRSIKSLIDRLRDRIPGLFLRTTFIVGFPGETDKDFEELLDFVRSARIERVGAFIYSAEEGTEAARLRGTVSKSKAEARFRTLMETQNLISRDLNRKLEGRVLPVLVDGFDDGLKLFYGRSEWDAPEIDQTVWIRGSAPAGRIVPVKIDDSSAYDCTGSIHSRLS